MTESNLWKLFQLDSNVLSSNGYAICAPFRANDGRLTCDSFVVGLLSTGEAVSRGCRITFSPEGDYAGVIQVNEEFAYAEALRQGEQDVRMLVYDGKVPSLSPESWVQVSFREVPVSRLAGAWMGGSLKQNLMRIGQVTGSKPLADFVDSLKALPTITRNGLAL